MAIIPILIALMLFLSKKQNSVTELLEKIDIFSVVEILKEFNIGENYLNYITPEFINSIKQGKIDIKGLLPLAIKFFTSKKGEKSHPENTIKMDFMDSEIKTALFNYLKS